MIERWLCEATSGTKEIGSGCYLTMVALSLNPRIEPSYEFYMKGSAFGIEAMKQGHYIGGDEKKAFKIANANISLPDERLKLFTMGRMNERGKHVEETSTPSGKEGGLLPPSSDYWRNEFWNAPSGQVPPEGRDNGEVLKLKHGGMEHRHRCRHIHHLLHMATLATCYHLTKE